MLRMLSVAGDVTIDWLSDPDVDWLDTPDRGTGPREDWRLGPGIRMTTRAGGAMLLAREVRLALEAVRRAEDEQAPTVVSYTLDGIENIPPAHVLHSVVEVTRCQPPDKSRAPAVFRVGRLLGFSGPDQGNPEPLPLAGDSAASDLLVLDDAGNGFRDRQDAWPAAIGAEGSQPLVVLKLARPLGGPLFQRVTERFPDALIVINAADLRAEGVDLSYRMSWERTARDFLWQMQHNPDLRPLAALRHLVVRFGLDGAIHYSGSPEGRGSAARLYFDPGSAEDEFRDRHRGDMIGLTDAFVAALVARLTDEGTVGIGEGVRDGIRSARRFFLAGFGADPKRLDYPGAEVFGPQRDGESLIADVVIPPSPRPDSPDPDWWCLLDELRTEALETIAGRIVREGEADALRLVPVGAFGGLRTVDRAEIESFRSVQNLIGQYLERRVTKRPLCLAVFGPPGSGKSFGVEQVAKSVAGLTDANVPKLEFNLSQFDSPADLVRAFHKVRDRVLVGEVPLVFFDEFDAEFHGPLGWLRSFLAPMQDGAFKDGEAVHPIGKAIFVFAGGLVPSFARFSREEFDPELDEAGRKDERRRFTEAKGPDFVSRLRGHINVRGPNPDPADPDDRTWLIRRATIVRVLLRSLWPALADPERPGQLNVDEGVVRALIGVPVYRHGVRSLEAIVETSQLHGKPSFEPSALPPPEQLDQHTDAASFTRLVQLGVRFAAAREATAEAIHEAYCRDRTGDRAADDPALRPWNQLDEILKRANRAQADDILRKLERIGCGFRPRVGEPAPFQFSVEEVELLAELEHERWMEERSAAGFTWGSVRDPHRKTSPFLIPWSQLEDAVRQYDRDAVLGIPGYLAQAGFELYRL